MISYSRTRFYKITTAAIVLSGLVFFAWQREKIEVKEVTTANTLIEKSVEQPSKPEKPLPPIFATRSFLKKIEQNSLSWSEILETMKNAVPKLKNSTAPIVNIQTIKGTADSTITLVAESRPNAFDPYSDMTLLLQALRSEDIFRNVYIASMEKKLGEKNAAIWKVNMALNAGLKQEKTIDGEENEIHEISEVEKEDLKKAIPEHLEQEKLIGIFQNRSKEADVTLNALTFTPKKDSVQPAIGIEGLVHGASENVIRFVKMLEVAPRKLFLKEVKIIRSESEGGIELFDLTLTAEAFYRKEE